MGCGEHDGPAFGEEWRDFEPWFVERQVEECGVRVAFAYARDEFGKVQRAHLDPYAGVEDAETVEDRREHSARGGTERTDHDPPRFAACEAPRPAFGGVDSGEHLACVVE